MLRNLQIISKFFFCNDMNVLLLCKLLIQFRPQNIMCDDDYRKRIDI